MDNICHEQNIKLHKILNARDIFIYIYSFKLHLTDKSHELLNINHLRLKDLIMGIYLLDIVELFNLPMCLRLLFYPGTRKIANHYCHALLSPFVVYPSSQLRSWTHLPDQPKKKALLKFQDKHEDIGHKKTPNNEACKRFLQFLGN